MGYLFCINWEKVFLSYFFFYKICWFQSGKNNALFFAVVLLQTFTLYGQDGILLKTDYLVNPIGIDNESPRLTWTFNFPSQGFQKEFKVLVSDGEQQNLILDSGWISGSSNLYTIDKLVLLPFKKYQWKVLVKKDDDSILDSQWATFETGILTTSNWQAFWISDKFSYSEKKAPIFRKEFIIPKKVVAARIYISSAGYHELFLNGKRIGHHRLDPAFTRYDRRNLYTTHDVTSDLTEGRNALGIILGNGWYNHQSSAVWDFHLAPWRSRPRVSMFLRIEYEDSTFAIIKTDESWKSNLSELVFNSIYTAEHVDFNLKIKDWELAGFNDSTWSAVTIKSAPSPQISAQSMHPVVFKTVLEAKELTKFNDRHYVINFGENIAGVCQLEVIGKKGTELRLIHGEKLSENGTVDLSNLDVHYRPLDESDPFQTDILILSGDKDFFVPKFNYKGFQFLELKADQNFEIERVNAIKMHSDVPHVGFLNSSNELINKLWVASNNSYLANLFGYPTDCPQREKNGWTGDAHINIETGLYNFDGITVYEKWMQDHFDEQQPNGVLPAIIPTAMWGYNWANGPDWTSSISIIPWNLYRFYGDTSILRKSYPHIKRYFDYLNSIQKEFLLDWGLGDWVPVKTVSNVEFTTSIYFFVNAQILSKIAAVLQIKDEALYYSKLAESIRTALNQKYFDNANAIYANGTQTELSMALYWGIVDEQHVSRVAAKLAEKVEANNNYIDTGLLGSKTILNALSDNGYAEVAYQMATKEDYPSWGWWINNGATTFFENWDVNSSSDISMNHIMFGEINAWFFKTLAGLSPDENFPGFKQFSLKPYFPKDLENFSMDFNSNYGLIQVNWQKTEFGKLIFKVNIPFNSKAVFDNIKNPSYKISTHNGEDVEENKGILVLEPGEHVFELSHTIQ